MVHLAHDLPQFISLLPYSLPSSPFLEWWMYRSVWVATATGCGRSPIPDARTRQNKGGVDNI